MVKHRGVRARGVAGQDCPDHGVVLLGGPQQSAFDLELGATERPDASTQSQRELGDGSIVRACIDCRMEGDVGVRIGVGVARLRRAPVIASWRACSRRRSIGVMLMAASRAQVASISAIATNRFSTCSGVALETTAPLRGRMSIKPLVVSCRSASRTGVRDTPCCCARLISSSRIPGFSEPSRMPSAMALASFSARVG